MKIFGSNFFISDFDKSLNKEIYGAWVASNEFYKNLIRFGTFDEYHFFILPGNINTRYFRYPKELLAYSHNQRIKFKKLIQLPTFLKNTEYAVFFKPDVGLFDILYLRNIYARKYFPICGLTHTLSYPFLLEVFFKNMSYDLQPFDTIICTSRTGLESLKKINGFLEKTLQKEMSISINYKGRLDHLSLGVNSQDYLKNNKDPSRKQLGLPLNKTIILYFGRFSTSDKADLYPVLVALKNLLLKRKDILLLFAGADWQEDYGKKIKNIAQDMGLSRYTKFLLRPRQEDKYLLYTASDIFIAPSDNLQETFGLTVLEAMASGLPTVVSDWNGYRDIVKHNETGFLIPTYWMKCDQEISRLRYLAKDEFHSGHLSLAQSICVDVKKMTDYLLLLINNKELRLKLGENARERVAREFDWSVVIPKYEKLWEKLSHSARDYKIPQKKIRLFIPHYFECFRHYPSRILNKRCKVRVTREGVRFIHTRDLPPGMPYFNPISCRIITLMLLFLKPRRTSSIGALQNYIKALLKKVTTEEVNYHIMWMLKKYLIEVKIDANAIH